MYGWVIKMIKTQYRMNKDFLISNENKKPVIDINTQGKPVSKPKIFRSGMVAMGVVAVTGGVVMSLTAPQPSYADNSRGNPNTVYKLSISGGEMNMNKRIKKMYSSEKINHFSYHVSPKETFDLNDDFTIQEDLKLPIDRLVDEQIQEISYKAKPKSVFEL